MPGDSTVDTCLAAVRRQATIFVLVVGCRYGSLSGDKSITNLEYLEARAKGIPIYVFADKEALSMLRLWEKNPNLDCSGVVDNPAVFQFLSELRRSANTWVFPFERAQDICDGLRVQWAFLMSQALEAMSRERAAPLPPPLASLTGRARRVLLEQGVCWEHELLAELLDQELASRYELRQSAKHGFVQSVRQIAPRQFPQLHVESSSILWGMLKTANALFPRASSEALGMGNREPDAQAILHVARQYGTVYEQAMNWKLYWHGVNCEEANAVELLAVLSTAPDNIIKELEAFPAKFRKEIEFAKEQIRQGVAPFINISIVFELPDGWPARVEQELHQLREWILANPEP